MIKVAGCPLTAPKNSPRPSFIHQRAGYNKSKSAAVAAERIFPFHSRERWSSNIATSSSCSAVGVICIRSWLHMYICMRWEREDGVYVSVYARRLMNSLIKNFLFRTGKNPRVCHLAREQQNNYWNGVWVGAAACHALYGSNRLVCAQHPHSEMGKWVVALRLDFFFIRTTRSRARALMTSRNHRRLFICGQLQKNLCDCSVYMFSLRVSDPMFSFSRWFQLLKFVRSLFSQWVERQRSWESHKIFEALSTDSIFRVITPKCHFETLINFNFKVDGVNC